MTITAGTYEKRGVKQTRAIAVLHITFLIIFCLLKPSTIVAMKRMVIFWLTVILQGIRQKKKENRKKNIT